MAGERPKLLAKELGIIHMTTLSTPAMLPTIKTQPPAMKKKESLLQSVLSARERMPGKHKDITAEHIELAKMWLKDEVTISQLNAGLKLTSAGAYTTIARALKASYKNGDFKIS